MTPDTDGRWTALAAVLTLLACALAYAGLWHALMPGPAVEWAGFGEYTGWAEHAYSVWARP